LVKLRVESVDWIGSTITQPARGGGVQAWLQIDQRLLESTEAELNSRRWIPLNHPNLRLIISPSERLTLKYVAEGELFERQIDGLPSSA
jgi:hypothetical protein